MRVSGIVWVMGGYGQVCVGRRWLGAEVHELVVGGGGGSDDEVVVASSVADSRALAGVGGVLLKSSREKISLHRPLKGRELINAPMSLFLLIKRK